MMMAGNFSSGRMPSPNKIRLHNSWRRFFQREVGRLLQQDEFTLAILTAAVFANQERGVAAEAQYHLFLEDDYARG